MSKERPAHAEENWLFEAVFIVLALVTAVAQLRPIKLRARA